MAPTPNTKSASNRLMGMKFMQRAAASSPATPSTSHGPPSKRQRLSTGGEESPSVRNADREAVQAALAEEEAKRTEALERQAAAAGETHWVLSFREPEKGLEQPSVMHVKTAGYAHLDRHIADESEDEAPELGRRTFGKPAPKVAANADTNDSSGSDSDSVESDENEDDDPAAVMIREQRKTAAREARRQKKRAETEKLAQMAEKRRKKEVKLNRQSGTGFSSGGNNTGNSPNSSNITCHGCGDNGHIKRDCPKKGDAKKRRSLDH
ncbi:hypothetical protein K490DRAFT_53713 [Saccharata proteae CBS 121410]|uniref:CCHC-type domain-containing protein n=1 Tax=Saccharata proteae CBS 121410 TaxID=1314787 RepID=A0A9P4I057_9PEZI|nr:hypothetical protein K490DRAFT_53713 [Saccharata proteae CBS 121410]